MNKVFNTAFEISLRILLILEASENMPLTVDRLAAVDFITVYAKEFGISNANLHGNNSFKYSEFALRRELTQEAVKRLVLDDLATVTPAWETGFVYHISNQGKAYCEQLSGDYAYSYRQLVAQVLRHALERSDQYILKLINNRSLNSLKRSVY